MTAADAATERAALEDQRDELFRSLRRLDDEFASGELDEVDFEHLRDDLTARAAEVLRRLEAPEEPAAGPVQGSSAGVVPTGEPAVDAATAVGPDARTTAAAPAGGRRRVGLLWVAGVAAFVVLAGLLVVQASGQRGSTDLPTGDIRQTTRDLLLVAREQWSTGRGEEALETYAEVLAMAPNDVEALTYTAWVGRTIVGSLDDDEALALLDEAVAIDPDYGDARVFRALVRRDLGDAEGALADLDSLSIDAVPSMMIEQVTTVAADLRRSVVGEGANDALAEEAFALFAEGAALDGLQLLDEALDDDSADADDAVLFAVRGIILAEVAVRSGDEDRALLGASALRSLDRAVALDPDATEWVVRRAEVRFVLGDLDGARADLALLEDRSVPFELGQAVNVLRAELRAEPRAEPDN
ncbi:MAG: hypothetical protein JJU45_17115 [Acidimicrobiia bacterium]|nr:hypothetical protein [Acidimicrobiia bacterium]